MKTNHINLKPDRLNFPLETLAVGRLSSAVATIGGDVPDDVRTLLVKIGRTPDPDTGETRTPFAAAATEVSVAGCAARFFRCYCSPYCFPDAADSLSYSVVGMDDSGNPRWLGSGVLRVLECPAEGSGDEPQIVPADTYIRNPVTGLYHLLTATVDDTGTLCLNLADEGVER